MVEEHACFKTEIIIEPMLKDIHLSYKTQNHSRVILNVVIQRETN